MIIPQMRRLHAIQSATIAVGLLAQVIVAVPRAYAAGETTTKPWSAPTGHRQPRAIDIPETASAAPQTIDPEDAYVDRKIRRICRGC
jgi:hypothetical protein